MVATHPTSWSVGTILLLLSPVFLLNGVSCMAPPGHTVSRDAWAETVAWMVQNGAKVNNHLRANVTFHGGLSVRGVVSTAKLDAPATLLHIPRKLWVTLDQFPKLRNASMPEIKQCQMESALFDQVKLALAVASEARKGDSSFWAPYLRILPELQDFEAFHAGFAEHSLLADFRALPAAETAYHMQIADNQTRKCVEAWQRSGEHPEELSWLTWNNVRLALAWVRTRTCSVDEGKIAMVPGFDMLNTAPTTSLNTIWWAGKEGFELQTIKSVAQSTELIDPYCATCDNNVLVGNWGVYLEDNINEIKSSNQIDCAARVFGSTQNSGKTFLEVTKSALQLDEVGSEAAKNWRAPRCKAATLSSSHQGLLRCSFARLAWEYCANQWGFNVSDSSSASSEISSSPLDGQTAEEDLDKKLALLSSTVRSQIHLRGS